MKINYSSSSIRSTAAFAILSVWLSTATGIVHGAPGDENWDNRFGSPGIGGIFSPSVSAIAVSGTDVYVGGQFIKRKKGSERKKGSGENS